jgi:hypothetical protein
MSTECVGQLSMLCRSIRSTIKSNSSFVRVPSMRKSLACNYIGCVERLRVYTATDFH